MWCCCDHSRFLVSLNLAYYPFSSPRSLSLGVMSFHVCFWGVPLGTAWKISPREEDRLQQQRADVRNDEGLSRSNRAGWEGEHEGRLDRLLGGDEGEEDWKTCEDAADILHQAEVWVFVLHSLCMTECSQSLLRPIFFFVPKPHFQNNILAICVLDIEIKKIT